MSDSTTASNPEFYESLRQIGDYLIENRAKTEYVLDCFFQQDVRGEKFYI